jgi:hypothetical protein
LHKDQDKHKRQSSAIWLHKSKQFDHTWASFLVKWLPTCHATFHIVRCGLLSDAQAW